jgi:hypothetical protein
LAVALALLGIGDLALAFYTPDITVPLVNFKVRDALIGAGASSLGAAFLALII